MKRLCALMFVLCMMLTGCTLAQNEEAPQDTMPTDQLIGMLITVDYFLGEEPDIYEDLPVWNAESSGMADPLHYASNQGKRLYAELVPEEYEVDGEIRTTMTYKFPEGTGIPYMSFLVLENGERENYWSCVDSPEISSVNRHLKTTDEESFIELSAVIYVDARATDLVLHLNPVHQTPEGEVYALGTYPVGFHAVSMSGCPQTLSQTVETSIGEIKVSGGSVTLEIQAVNLPEKYVIIEMDGENTAVCSAEYAPEEMPKVYEPREETRYLLVEAHHEKGITRTVCDRNDETARIQSFYPSDYGILIQGWTSIEWEGTK